MDKKNLNRTTINFSKRLIELLERKGLSSTRSTAGVNFNELAKAVGCSNQMARKYTLGQALPDADTILKIAHYLNASPGWLLFGENPTAPIDANQSELVGIDYELLRHILHKISPLFVSTENANEVVNFAMDIIYDASHLNTDRKTIFKIIEISISSAERFQKTSMGKDGMYKSNG